VHERVYDEFVEKSKARAENRVVGDPFKKGVEQGPQVHTVINFQKCIPATMVFPRNTTPQGGRAQRTIFYH
jgi:hypothetical protein